MGLSARDHVRLVGVHPALIADLDQVFDWMRQTTAHPMFVVQGVRTVQQQGQLYAKGRTLPGTIVTMKDGIRHRSNHQPHADGLGHAVDCAFLNVADPFAGNLPWEAYGARLEALGLVWGGRWKHPHDSPHAELPDAILTKAA